MHRLLEGAAPGLLLAGRLAKLGSHLQNDVDQGDEHAEDDDRNDGRNDVEVVPGLQDIVAALLTDVCMLILRARTATKQLVLLAVRMTAVSIAECQGAPAVCLLWTNTHRQVLTVSQYLALLRFDGIVEEFGGELVCKRINSVLVFAESGRAVVLSYEPSVP